MILENSSSSETPPDATDLVMRQLVYQSVHDRLRLEAISSRSCFHIAEPLNLLTPAVVQPSRSLRMPWSRLCRW